MPFLKIKRISSYKFLMHLEAMPNKFLEIGHEGYSEGFGLNLQMCKLKTKVYSEYFCFSCFKIHFSQIIRYKICKLFFLTRQFDFY